MISPNQPTKDTKMATKFLERSQPPEAMEPGPDLDHGGSTLHELAPTSMAVRGVSDGNGGKRFTIPGDKVNQATADLPDDQRSAIRWFHSHCYDNNVSMTEAGPLIRYDGSTLHRVFSGKYNGDLRKVCQAITDFRRLHEERAKAANIGFIETGLYRQIEKACDLAREFQRFVFMWGDKQIGKTEAFLHYERTHNHGSTRYVRMPAGGALYNVLARLAETLRISGQAKEKELIKRIFDAVDDRMLIVWDEIDQVLLAKAGRGLKTLEFIRDLYDKTKCGMVICANQEFREEMEMGKNAEWMKRFGRRGLFQIPLPDRPSAADLNTFSRAFGLPPATGEFLQIQTDVITADALGKWLILLKMASKLATKRKRKMTWSDVREARIGLAKLAEGLE